MDDTQANTNKASKKIIFGLTAAFLVLLVIAASFYSGFYLGNQKFKSAQDKIKSLTRLNNPNNKFYVNLQGSFNGEITKIDGDKAYVESNRGGQGIFSIPNPVEVQEVKQGKINTLGTTRDKVILNENAEIKIAGYGEGYAIYSVVYYRDPVPNFTSEDSSAAANLKKTNK